MNTAEQQRLILDRLVDFGRTPKDTTGQVDPARRAALEAVGDAIWDWFEATPHDFNLDAGLPNAELWNPVEKTALDLARWWTRYVASDASREDTQRALRGLMSQADALATMADSPELADQVMGSVSGR